MVRRVSPAEYQRLMREAARKQQDAINAYNREVDRVNRENQRRQQANIDAINRHNRQVDSHNREVYRQQKQAIENYNRQVRAHNTRVVANRHKQQAAIRQLNQRVVTVRYNTLHSSTVLLNDAYDRLERRVADETSDANDDLILNLPSRENTNSLELVNALLQEDALGPENQPDLQQTKIEAELRQISGDLDQRWRGALFSLSPQNPDAARHFCTSVREIINGILEARAPDAAVAAAFPNCPLTPNGTPTRRSKVQYILQRRGITTVELGDFIEADITNVVDLFQVLIAPPMVPQVNTL